MVFVKSINVTRHPLEIEYLVRSARRNCLEIVLSLVSSSGQSKISDMLQWRYSTGRIISEPRRGY